MGNFRERVSESGFPQSIVGWETQATGSNIPLSPQTLYPLERVCPEEGYVGAWQVQAPAYRSPPEKW